jgi:predicted enzyme related to lactoylglutathione lyase
MQKVIGIGGFFFKAKDVKKLAAWYEKFLGINFGDSTYFNFNAPPPGHPKNSGGSALSFFKEDTKYFNPSDKQFMLNLRVENLEALIEELKKENVTVIGDIEDYDYGKFGWILDPEGNKLELWEEKVSS